MCSPSRTTIDAPWYSARRSARSVGSFDAAGKVIAPTPRSWMRSRPWACPSGSAGRITVAPQRSASVPMTSGSPTMTFGR